jgi:hypothetical protein
MYANFDFQIQVMYANNNCNIGFIREVCVLKQKIFSFTMKKRSSLLHHCRCSCKFNCRLSRFLQVFFWWLRSRLKFGRTRNVFQICIRCRAKTFPFNRLLPSTTGGFQLKVCSAPKKISPEAKKSGAPKFTFPESCNRVWLQLESFYIHASFAEPLYDTWASNLKQQSMYVWLWGMENVAIFSSHLKKIKGHLA